MVQSSCPVCTGRGAVLISATDRDGRPLKTVACTGCGLYRTDPLPSADEIGRFHEKTYRQLYKGVRRPKLKHIHRSAKLAAARLDRLEKYLGPRARVLDIGCASGEWLYVLGLRGHAAVGIEVDPSYAAFGREEYAADIRPGTVMSAEFPAGSFDCVTLFHVIEHLPDPLGALERIRPWLSGEGVLAVEAPNVESPHQHPAKRFHYAHAVGFTPASLAYALRKAGWRIEEISLDAYERNLFAVARPGGEAREGPPAAAALAEASGVVRYYLRASTYARWAGRMAQFLGEFRAARKGRSPKEIVGLAAGRR